MFSGEMVTGPLLIGIFILSIAILLLLILKFKLNAFVALLMTSFGTGLLVNMPLTELTQTVTDGFGSTLGGIGMVTGLGVMLGKFMYESGGIDSISNKILNAFGERKAPVAAALSGFITGIPVFGDVVYIMFAPMLRVLSKKTKISMTTFACALAVATTCTFSLVLPTAPPLAVAEELNVEIGIFFFYALIAAFVGMAAGGIGYGYFINYLDHKNHHFYTFDDLEEVSVTKEETGEKMGALKALSILLVPILMILMGSFVPLIFGTDAAAVPVFEFIGNKNFAMMAGVIYAAVVSRKYIQKTATDLMTEAADQIGLVLLITGAGGAFGKVLQATGIADFVAGTLSGFHIPILLLCFLISQIIRLAQGSTTVALMTTAAIMSSTIAGGNVSPILCAIAICAGGIGLSLPNDSGFWAISRFFKISVKDTLKGWTMGGFVAGIAVLLFVSVLSLFQNILPGLMV